MGLMAASGATQRKLAAIRTARGATGALPTSEPLSDSGWTDTQWGDDWDSLAEWSERMVARGEASATRLKQSAAVRWIEEAGVFADPVRLGAALVETIVLRKLLAPVLVPLKLMVALRFAQRWSRRRRVRG